jgi:hypothetical protein
MNQETIEEFQEIVSSTYISSTSDFEAKEKLALLGTDLRKAIEELLKSWDANPSEYKLQAYLGVMLLNVVKTTNKNLLTQLSQDSIPAGEVIKILREQSALKIEKTAQKEVKRLEEHNPEYLWTGIQLALLVPIQQQWSTSVDLEKLDNE